ncbi:glycosyltransferase [Ferruginibacter sp. SUN106]|uniref:glycosyltransferase n=1 Tax=Ferruginibacter sp. SUN106 TaxID=2978348 RepID=UPI003D365BB1
MTENKNKIKLLIITPTLECGGAEKYVALLCNHLNPQQFELTVAVVNNSNPFYTINNRVTDLKTKHVRNSLFGIKALVKKYQPDIIFSTANHLNIYLAVFRWLFPAKTIFIARESSVVSINSKRAKLPALYNRLIKKYYQRFNCIICQSQYMQQDLTDHYHIKKEQTVVINNAVEQESNKIMAAAKNKFVTIARLSPEKGIDRLLHAVAGLTIPFNYHIIGEGNEMVRLKELVDSFHLNDKVFFYGKKDKPFTGMEDASLFLMGSQYEGFPNTLLEAGALGIPVVAFNAPGGIGEILYNGENGLLVNESGEKAFAQAIEKALQIPFNRQQISEHTLQRFSLQQCIEKTEHVFVQLYQQAQNGQ